MSERSYDERPRAPPQTPPSDVQDRREHVTGPGLHRSGTEDALNRVN